MSLQIEHSTDFLEWARMTGPGGAVSAIPFMIEPMSDDFQRVYHRIGNGHLSGGYFRVVASPRGAEGK